MWVPAWAFQMWVCSRACALLETCCCDEAAAAVHRSRVPAQLDLVCHHLSVYMSPSGAAATGVPRVASDPVGLELFGCL